MTDQAMSPLRRRMIEDMTIRRVATKTIQQVMSPLDRITMTQAEPPA